MNTFEDYVRSVLKTKKRHTEKKLETLRDKDSKTYMKGYFEALNELERMIDTFDALKQDQDVRQTVMF